MVEEDLDQSSDRTVLGHVMIPEEPLMQTNRMRQAWKQHWYVLSESNTGSSGADAWRPRFAERFCSCCLPVQNLKIKWQGPGQPPTLRCGVYQEAEWCKDQPELPQAQMNKPTTSPAFRAGKLWFRWKCSMRSKLEEITLFKRF